ncbi:MAG: tetratricopeptide repeat protein, partial [Acidobacteria bacterium]|nr:tetratricopeptide repeat protein [Acidobacteriota bacterium]
PGPPEAAAPWVRTHWWQTDRALSDLTTRAWADGDTASALALAEAGHRRHPQEPTLAYNLGSLLLEAPAAEGAEPAVAASEAALETALETVPSSASSPSLAADAWYNLGLARVARGETDKALEAFTNALRADPEHDDARHNLEWLLRLPPPQAPPPEPPPPESSPPVPEPPPPSSGSPQPRPG